MFKKYILIACLALTSCAAHHPPLSTVPSVNLKRYMGTWYEIASFPTTFQRGCQCTTAHYALQNKEVQITNTCYKGSNYTKSSANGIAWAVPNSGNSKLKVQFFWQIQCHLLRYPSEIRRWKEVHSQVC